MRPEAPKLDDHTFQDLVDEAKRRVAAACPEWTDLNVSDPGVALIEVFAFLTEQYLYRLNRVPERSVEALLNLAGGLRPARAARGAVTFRLSRSPDPGSPLVIAAGTEVSTRQDHGRPEVSFWTDSDTRVATAVLRVAQKSLDGASLGSGWQKVDLTQPFSAWATTAGGVPATAALALGFDDDLSAHDLLLTVDLASGSTAVDCVWEVYRAAPGGGPADGWAVVAARPIVPGPPGRPVAGRPGLGGQLILELPSSCKGTAIGGESAQTWVRCRPAAALTDTSKNPTISLKAATAGVTVPVTQARPFRRELLGYGDGKPGQRFRLANRPALEPDEFPGAAGTERFVVEVDGSPWTRVAFFENAEGHENDRHFVFDAAAGVVEFAPEVAAPGNRRCPLSAVPAPGQPVVVRLYHTCDGPRGNVGRGAAVVSKRAYSWVESITNRLPIKGGRPAQTLDEARIRPLWHDASGARAVTHEDFEAIAVEVPGVGRFRSYTTTPGTVTAVVIPVVRILPDDELDRLIDGVNAAVAAGTAFPADRSEFDLPDETADRLRAALKPRMLLGTGLDVRSIRYKWVKVETTIRVESGKDPARVGRAVLRRLYRWLHPLTGGTDGRGWAFGNDLRIARTHREIGNVPGVYDVEDVTISVWKQDSQTGAWFWVPEVTDLRTTIQLRDDEMFASVAHDVTARHHTRA